MGHKGKQGGRQPGPVQRGREPGRALRWLSWKGWKLPAGAHLDVTWKWEDHSHLASSPLQGFSVPALFPLRDIKASPWGVLPFCEWNSAKLWALIIPSHPETPKGTIRAIH